MPGIMKATIDGCKIYKFMLRYATAGNFEANGNCDGVAGIYKN